MSDDKRVHHKRLGRELAMQFLFQFDCGEREFDPRDFALFVKCAGAEDASSDDRRFRRAAKYAEKLVSAVLGDLERIDGKIKALLSEKWSWERLAVVDKAILRVAAAEMLVFDDVPPLVAIDEAIEIAKKYGDESSKAFVNGLLDALKNIG